MSNYKLSDTEQFVLAHGLDFRLPPTNLKREHIFAEFEVLLSQPFHHTGKSKEELQALKARLSDLAHAYCGTAVDLTDFLMHRERFEAIKSLRLNSDIIITKPDKGPGVVILNKSDYLTKVNSILNDSSKFQNIGPVNDNDNTAKTEERKLQKWLLKLHKDGYFTELEYNEIRLTDSQRPKMYGLPKTHKPDVPLRPILFMIGSSQHQLAKYCLDLLQPVLEIYSNICIKDSFLFAEEIRQLKLNQMNLFFAPLTSLVFSPTFLWLKPFNFVLILGMKMTELFRQLSQKIFFFN